MKKILLLMIIVLVGSNLHAMKNIKPYDPEGPRTKFARNFVGLTATLGGAYGVFSLLKEGDVTGSLKYGAVTLGGLLCFRVPDFSANTKKVGELISTYRMKRGEKNENIKTLVEHAGDLTIKTPKGLVELVNNNMGKLGANYRSYMNSKTSMGFLILQKLGLVQDHSLDDIYEEIRKFKAIQVGDGQNYANVALKQGKNYIMPWLSNYKYASDWGTLEAWFNAGGSYVTYMGSAGVSLGVYGPDETQKTQKDRETLLWKLALQKNDIRRNTSEPRYATCLFKENGRPISEDDAKQIDLLEKLLNKIAEKLDAGWPNKPFFSAINERFRKSLVASNSDMYFNCRHRLLVDVVCEDRRSGNKKPWFFPILEKFVNEEQYRENIKQIIAEVFGLKSYDDVDGLIGDQSKDSGKMWESMSLPDKTKIADILASAFFKNKYIEEIGEREKHIRSMLSRIAADADFTNAVTDKLGGRKVDQEGNWVDQVAKKYGRDGYYRDRLNTIQLNGAKTLGNEKYPPYSWKCITDKDALIDLLIEGMGKSEHSRDEQEEGPAQSSEGEEDGQSITENQMKLMLEEEAPSIEEQRNEKVPEQPVSDQYELTTDDKKIHDALIHDALYEALQKSYNEKKWLVPSDYEKSHYGATFPQLQSRLLSSLQSLSDDRNFSQEMMDFFNGNKELGGIKYDPNDSKRKKHPLWIMLIMVRLINNAEFRDAINGVKVQRITGSSEGTKVYSLINAGCIGSLDYIEDPGAFIKLLQDALSQELEAAKAKVLTSQAREEAA